MKRTFTFLVSLFLMVGTMWADVTDLPQISTVEKPIYYTIMNTRSSQPGGLMYFAGDAVGLKDEQTVVLEAKHKFFFTGSHDAMYIHNAATGKKLASVGSWTEDGAVWAVGVSPMGGGLAFGPKGGLNGNSCWNEKNFATDEKTSDFTTWSANDAGSIFIVDLAEDYVFPMTDLFYVIEAPLFEKTQGVKKAIYVNNEGKAVWGTEDLTNHNFYWIPTVNAETGKVVLKNFGTQTYLSSADGTMAAESKEATLKILGDCSFNININGTIHANNHDGGKGSGSNFVSWGGNAGSASAWRFVQKNDPTKLQEAVVTYNLTYGDEVKYTQTVTTLVGEEWPAITVALPYTVSATKPEGVIAAEDLTDGAVTKEIALTIGELPFVAAADVKSIDTWYYVKMHSNTPKYIQYLTDQTYLEWVDAEKDETAKDTYAWAFVGNIFDGFKVVNKAAAKAMQSTADGAVVLVDYADASQYVLAATRETSEAAKSGFCLRRPDANKECLNASAGKVAHWWDNDAGSTFMLEVVENEPEVEYADETLINAFIAEVVALGELSYDLDATWAALPAVSAELDAVTPLIEQLGDSNPVAKADVEAATATVANAKAVATYYNETYLPTAKAATELLAALENGSAEHTALSAAIAACDLSAVTTVAELETMEAALAEAVEANTPEGGLVKTDYTDAIKNAAVTSLNEWTVEGEDISHGDGLVKLKKNFDFNQTITLPAGKYKMTVKAAYRYAGGSVNVAEKAEYDAIQAGVNTHLAKVYAQTATCKYEGDVQNRWEGRSETDLYGNLEKVSVIEHEGVTYYVPNSSAAVMAWFNADKYVNELVFNVQEEGEVKIGMNKTETAPNGEYTNISAWTLTRLGDAEADPKEEEPTPTPDPEDPSEEAWGPSTVGNGKFYLYNVGAQGYLFPANNHAVHASVTKHGGILVELQGSDNVYTISTNETNAGKFMNDGGWMDGDAYGWTFELVSEGVYKLKSGENVLYWNGEGSTNTTTGADPGTDAAHWMLITEGARRAGLAEATAQNPVDATFFIKNPNISWGNGKYVGGHKDFDLSNSPSWKGTKLTDVWGPDANNEEANIAIEQYGKVFDNYQELKNIPNGLYHLTAKGFYRGNVAPYVYANDKKCELKVKGDIGGDNLWNAGAALRGDDYLLEGVDVLVTDGALRVGVKSDEQIEWCVFDEFRLSYYGEAEDPEAAALAQKKEAFLARAEKFRTFVDNNVDWSLTVINQTYLYPVSDEVLGDASLGVVGLVDKMDEVTDVAVLDHWMAEMDKAEAVLTEAAAAAAEFAKWQALIQHAAGFAATYDEATAEAAMMYMEFSVGYNCATVEAIETAAAEAATAYKNFVLGATPVKDEKFDLTFAIVNPNFEADVEGWTCKEAKWNNGRGYNDVSGIAEIANWGASSWEASMSQTLNNLPNGKYIVKMAWMAANGIKMTIAANESSVEVVGIGDQGGNIAKDGTVVEMGQGFRGWQYAEVEALVEDGTLAIAVNSAANAEHMWSNADAFELYYAGAVVAEPEYLTVVGAKVGDVAIVEGKATVESISSFEITFDRPVALAEDAEWAQLTDKWGDNPLKAEVLEDNNCVVRFSLQWGQEFTEAGDFYLYIPEGVVVDAENVNCINAAIEAVITVEGGSVEPATPLAVVNVTVGEDVMSDLSAIVATTEDMIKVNFDGKFYFQGEPSIVDAEGNDASSSFEYMNGLDVDGSNSYIFMGKKEGTYTITLAKAQFNELEMMGWKAPAEDIVLTVTISVPDGIQNINADADAVIYDIHGRRVEKMTKGLYIVNGRKVMVK